jgi:hypothetical protein
MEKLKYLKFLSQKNISHFNDYFQMNFTFVINDSVDKVSDFEITDVKSIAIRLSGREDASLRATENNYELEPAFFEIAKNYLMKKVSENSEIRGKEELFINASEYLNLGSNPILHFHNEIIKIEVDDS